MVDVAPEMAARANATPRMSTRRYYVLALLTVVYALNFLDRTIFNAATTAGSCGRRPSPPASRVRCSRYAC
jgi:hypothetical protein